MSSPRDNSDDLEFSTEVESNSDRYWRVDRNDLIHLEILDHETGEARIVVWESTECNSGIAFEGTVNVRAHEAAEDDDAA